MAIHVAIEHRTTYSYDRLVALSPHVVRLRPAPHTRTPILSYSLDVSPGDHFVSWQQDPFGNHIARFVFPEKARELDVKVGLVADMTPINPFDFFLDEDAEQWPVPFDPQLWTDLRPYTRRIAATDVFADFVEAAREEAVEGRRTIDVLVGLNQRVLNEVAYDVRMEPGVQSPYETLRRGIGSCRDSAWLLVQLMRNIGLPARFASGYLVQLAADQAALDGPSGPTEDFTDLHAWTEVFVPGAGWIGMDPTSGLFAGEGHIPLACTPAPTSAAPIEGATDKAEVTFHFVNEVTRIHEDPRVTKPYSDEQWAAIDALGERVDARLRDGDVRLTQGGEPTFVSVDDRESLEWTIAADGPMKRTLAWDLTERLATRFADGGFIQQQQGKWYPGEPLPRWQFGLYWRTDGEPLWQDRELLADPWKPGDHDHTDARRVAAALAARVGVTDDTLVPAYEDALHALWMESQLPAGEVPTDVDADDETLKDARARAALTRRLDATLGRPVGFALPLRHEGGSWVTSAWTFRRGRMHLMPGDSPMGLRLPLQSVSWTPRQADPEQDPLEPRTPLPRRGALRAPDGHDPRVTTPGLHARAERTEALRQQTGGELNAAWDDHDATGRPSGTDGHQPRPPLDPPDLAGTPAAGGVVPSDGSLSAVCVEERDGRIHVFLPPLTHLDHAVELLAAVEDVATETGLQVVVEGYGPPADPRVQSITIAPDPGVIEVNVHPATSWQMLRDTTEGLYEDARQARLSTETFDLDGLHTGTGGGNHITLGGATPADSPLLRRPSLLRGLITYWQHHPSLSYLFSSRFIGATSQAPRVDEGRDDRIGQLQIALDELDALDRRDEDVPPWMVDRLLRHLLTDLTGNTHRAEFCIDKLYSPDSSRGRLGLLELRGFEMPPHERMGMVQNLLVRSIVTRLWEDPYRASLTRWGTLLHDRFLLPWHVERDADEVVGDLRAHGVEFERGWLAPFHEFRFPRLGTVRVGDVELELRAGIEPWDVLGEEVTAQGTSRFVDSSMERLQVLARGETPGRHVLTVNGRPLPLHPTAEPGTSIAGVRYRAWHPPSGLHPTIGVHAPLTFDVVDRWNERSLGGCTYHVSPPNGRSYDDRPINAMAADARRTARFVPHGHTQGRVEVAALDRMTRAFDPDSPQTLDLRVTPPA